MEGDILMVAIQWCSGRRLLERGQSRLVLVQKCRLVVQSEVEIVLLVTRYVGKDFFFDQKTISFVRR